jgi:hypothetical protein
MARSHHWLGPLGASFCMCNSHLSHQLVSASAAVTPYYLVTLMPFVRTAGEFSELVRHWRHHIAGMAWQAAAFSWTAAVQRGAATALAAACTWSCQLSARLCTAEAAAAADGQQAVVVWRKCAH